MCLLMTAWCTAYFIIFLHGDRDLTPPNVFLDGEENVKLGDFGLATSKKVRDKVLEPKVCCFVFLRHGTRLVVGILFSCFPLTGLPGSVSRRFRAVSCVFCSSLDADLRRTFTHFHLKSGRNESYEMTARMHL